MSDTTSDRTATSGASEPALSARKAAILQAVVEGYITTSEPIGSSHVGQASGLDVSSATIRSEMVALEEAGYLTQPHTSAGRVPSDKGYRYFVDSLMEPAALGRSQTKRVASFFEAAQGELQRLLRDTSAFLSQLTDYAAVVVGPQPKPSPIRALQFVRLSTDQAMLVVVHANTAIERMMVPIAPEISDDALEAAAVAVSEGWVGFTREETRTASTTGDPIVDELAARLSDALADATASTATATADVFVDGTSSVVDLFDAVEKVKDVLLVLEKQYTVVTLVKDVIDRGLDVAIGSETGLEPLAECSLIVSPVEVDGELAGTIGVLGPTRMHYSEAMATVALVSRQMSRRLSDGTA